MTAGAGPATRSGPAGPLRIAIIEDHQLLTSALSAALTADGHTVEAPALTTAEEVREVLGRLAPAVVLLDLDLGAFGRGENLLSTLTDLGARVLVVSGTNEDWRVGRCLASGAWGWVHKSADFDVLLDALLRAGAGQEVLDPAERDRLLRAWREQREVMSEAGAPFERLTRREAVVLARLMEGVPVERIASESYVSVATVRTQVRAILMKLGVSSQLEAVARANRAGWSPAHP